MTRWVSRIDGTRATTAGSASPASAETSPARVSTAVSLRSRSVHFTSPALLPANARYSSRSYTIFSPPARKNGTLAHAGLPTRAVASTGEIEAPIDQAPTVPADPDDAGDQGFASRTAYSTLSPATKSSYSFWCVLPASCNSLACW